MRNRTIFMFLFMMLISLSLMACSNTNEKAEKDGETETETEKDNGSENVNSEVDEVEGELRIAINAQPPSLDPLVSTATVTRDVALQIFEPLITINANLQPAPMLAESYETSEDGKTITFQLRKDIKFHNGKTMTSEDVVASMIRWQGISSRAKAAFSDAVFKADGDYTVLLELKEPNRTALAVLSSSTQMPAIMPVEVIDSAGADGISDYIGTGPFSFEDWKQDQYIKLTKFDDYQSLTTPSDGPSGKRVALVKDLHFHIVTDSTTRLAGMQSEEYDIATTMPFDSFKQIDSNSDLKTYMGPSGFNIIVFNKKEGAFADVKIRQAVAAALDMEAIMKASFSDEQFYDMNPGIMLKQQTDWYTDAGKNFYNEQDLDKAKNLLKEAGYNGEPVTFITSREYEDFYNASVVVKQQLEEIGMNINLEVFDWATIIEKQGKPSEFDAFITGFGINTDPTQLIFLHSKNEWAGWTNSPEIDGLIDKIRASSTQEEAQKYFEELQLEAWEYLPVLKFGDKNFLYAVSKDVEGFQDVIGMSLWNVTKAK